MATAFKVQPLREVDLASVNNLVRRLNGEFARVSEAIEDIVSGRKAFSGDIDLGGNRVTNAATPKANRDLMTLEHAESLFGRGTGATVGGDYASSGNQATQPTSEGTPFSSVFGTSEEEGDTEEEVLDVVDDIEWSVTTQTSDYTAVDTDTVILADATAGAFTITLPNATDGKLLFIKKTDSTSNNVTVDGESTSTIDGALTAVLTDQYESITIICNGTNWFIL